MSRSITTEYTSDRSRVGIGILAGGDEGEICFRYWRGSTHLLRRLP